MATGLPVLATRVGGNPELVQHGLNGTLVSPQDPMALTAALTLYLDNPSLRALHGSISRQRAAECFSLERMSAAYLHLYTDLLHHSRRRTA
jgi:glycosyltransferase involved in cell wall biosynthesis